MEASLAKIFPDDQKYAYEERGSATVRVYSQPYSKAYSDKLNGMVERQLRASIKAVGSLWYSAWVDAGQPKLKDLINPDYTKEAKKALDQEQKELESEHDGR